MERSDARTDCQRDPDEVDVTRVDGTKPSQVRIDPASEGRTTVASPQEDLVEVVGLLGKVCGCFGEREQ